MRTYLVTFKIRLQDTADTEFIEDAIYEKLEKGEDILEGNIEELVE